MINQLHLCASPRIHQLFSFHLAIAYFLCAMSVAMPVRLNAHGAILPPGFIEDLVADSLNPTSMCMDQDGRLFLAQKDGRILIVHPSGQLLEHPLVAIATDVTNERGLQGIALHPDFPDSSYIYTFYVIPEMGRNRVSRFTILGDLVVPGSERIIIEMDPMTGTVHNGGALAFGPQDGLLYISTSEAGKGVNSQDTTNVLGKILRLYPDGSIPESNPFYHRFTGKNRAIYALGFRNPFSMAFDQVSGLLHVCDVGSGFFEEVNIIYAGKNYGWPVIEGIQTSQDAPPDYQDPFYAYPHAAGCAIVGAAFYQPQQQVFPDSLRNHFFFGDYCNGTIYHMDPLHADKGSMIFATEIHRPLALLTAADGSVYYLAREGQGGGSQEDNKISTDGTLWRIRYTGNGQPYVSLNPSDALLSVGEKAVFAIKALGEEPLTYQWYLNDEPLFTGTADSFSVPQVTAIMDGWLFTCVVTNGVGADTSTSATLSVTTNTRPELFMDMPLTGQTYKAGDTLRFSGHAVDAEEGLLDPAHYTWRIDFHHKTHSHPALAFLQGVGHGEYIIPVVNETDPAVWYRVHFFAADSGGLSSATYTDVMPDLSRISIVGPTGVRVNLDGRILELPVIVEGVQGLKHIIVAPEHAVANDSLLLWKQYAGGISDLLYEFEGAETDTVIKLEYYSYALGNGSGLLGEYFDDPEADMDGEPNVIRIDTVIDFSWGGGPPSFNFPRDLFTVRWTGWVTPFLDGEWTFYVRSDDGCRLWIDDQLVIDEWHGQPPTEFSWTINLQGGHNYSIRLDYLEEDGGSEVELAWSHAAMDRAIIPKTQLIPARLVGRGSVEGQLWIDANYNNVYDEGEARLEQVTLLLYRQLDTTLYAAINAVDGFFKFTDVKEDLYHLQVIYTGADPELIPSFGVGSDGFSDPIFVQTGFTYEHPVAFSRRRGRIVGRVWVDENANGFPEDTERGLEHVLCIMYKLSTGMFSIEQTNAEGVFTCEDVEPGLIKLELANVPDMNSYIAGVGLEDDFTTSVFSHEVGEDHFFLLGLVPVSTSVQPDAGGNTMIYPNPLGDMLYVEAEPQDIVRLRVWSGTGLMVLEKQVDDNGLQGGVDIRGLLSGIYFVELVHVDGKRKYHKVVRQ